MDSSRRLTRKWLGSAVNVSRNANTTSGNCGHNESGSGLKSLVLEYATYLGDQPNQKVAITGKRLKRGGGGGNQTNKIALLATKVVAPTPMVGLGQ